MKNFLNFLNEKNAKIFSKFLCYVCYFVILFFLFCIVLSFMGRQSFILHTSTGVYENAIYAEEDHDSSSRSMTVSMAGERVYVNSTDNVIDPAIHIALSLMYAVNIVPLIIAYWFLSKVFANISKGKIFVNKNAAYLLYYGIIRFVVALFVPLIKLLICELISLISADSISIGTGAVMLNDLIPSIAFIVAAYIIHYGIRLQDEVDHTL